MRACRLFLPFPANQTEMLLLHRKVHTNYLTGDLGALYWNFTVNTRFGFKVGCNKGEWIARYGVFDPQSCLPGTYRTRTSASTLGECTPCRKGHFCNWKNWSEGLATPRLCPQGTYRATEGATKESDCKRAVNSLCDSTPCTFDRIRLSC